MNWFRKKPGSGTNSEPESDTGPGPINIVDVGCRWGFAERFTNEKYVNSFKVYGFDPDQEECKRLEESYAHLPAGYVNCIPLALAGHQGVRNLFLTKEPACSSLHPPIAFLAERYPALECIHVERIASTEVTTLSAWAAEAGVHNIDYIKLDTQGSELEILKGGADLLNRTRCIDIEVEFNPIYQGQSLFGETDSFLRAHGFSLWRLSNLVHYSLGGPVRRLSEKNSVCFDTHVRQENEAYGGQLFWADARYVHRDVLVTRRRTHETFRRDAILFDALGMVDVIDHMNRIAENP